MKRGSKNSKSKSKKEIVIEAKWNTYNYNYESVMSYCNTLSGINEKLLYLEYVLKEKKNNSEVIEVDKYFNFGTSFEEKISNEIRYLEKKIELCDPYRAKGYEKIVWQKNKQDFPALFNTMINLGFFTFRKNKWEMLSNHFTWNDGEMTAEQLKYLLSNINNKPETHQLSDEVNFIINKLEK